MNRIAFRLMVGFCSAGLFALVGPEVGRAQSTRSTNDLLQAFRDKSADADWIGYALADRLEGFSRADREEMADSLEAVAMRPEEDLLLATDAVLALGFAGRPRNEKVYEGSELRLRRIIDQVEGAHMKVVAFSTYLSLPGSGNDVELIERLVYDPGDLGLLATQAILDNGQPGTDMHQPALERVLRFLIEKDGLPPRGGTPTSWRSTTDGEFFVLGR